MGLSGGGVQGERLLEGLEGGFHLAFLVQRGAQVDEGVKIVRVDSRRLAEGGLGRVELPGVAEQIAQIEVGLRVVGFEPDRFPEAGLRLAGLALESGPKAFCRSVRVVSGHLDEAR